MEPCLAYSNSDSDTETEYRSLQSTVPLCSEINQRGQCTKIHIHLGLRELYRIVCLSGYFTKSDWSSLLFFKGQVPLLGGNYCFRVMLMCVLNYERFVYSGLM